MIGYIIGKTGNTIDNKLLIKLPSGLGYLININPNDFYQQNDTIELFIYEARKEDKIDLYGFQTIKEREWMEKLLKVGGVGPKMAALIIYQLGSKRLLETINAKDTDELKQVKGLGAKTAKKIILELSNNITVDEMNILGIEKSKTISDFTETLSGLGYNRGLIVSTITAMKRDKVWDETNLKEMVKIGLKYMSRK
ncbi:hypothetical protein HC864_04870 [Candidatus Gracilibacteria bacterium]|nr:hypothetical protein [Thermales bacterium]NJL97112.1 hypothetical protein [Candidatus Gracilibacteria bacterium]